jgi:hypothetical protein
MPGQQHTIDERRWERHKVDLRLRVITSSADASGGCYGRAHSLSPGGLGAYIPAAFPVGAEVGLVLILPDSKTELKLKGRICSCEGFRYGVEFRDITSDMQRTIVKACTAPQTAETQP